MRIALDAMGGDYAPEPNVVGAIEAVRENPALQILLVGDQDRLLGMLREQGYQGDAIKVVPSEGWIGMEEKPAEALRKKPRCSIIVTWQLMAEKQVDAVVSAGHTGAMVGAGLRTKLFLPGVKRPGIAVALPSLTGRTILMDVGANIGSRPEHLYQYGLMGAVYAREMYRVEKPRIGLMNIGSEDTKGIEVILETHPLFHQSHLKEHYVGNVEGRDLYLGGADVIVCDGFVGNVILKVSEGMADLLFRSVKTEVVERLSHEQAKAQEHLDEYGRRFSYHEAGGAPLLGVDGICLICHGSSKSKTITNALRAATQFKDRQINQRIIEELSRVPLTL